MKTDYCSHPRNPVPLRQRGGALVSYHNPVTPALRAPFIHVVSITSTFHTLFSPRSKPATQHPHPSTTGRNPHRPCGSSPHRLRAPPPAPVRGAPAARAARG